ncbi:MAG: helix-turn-helix domain-containing protein [Gelidibacter sp.]
MSFNLFNTLILIGTIQGVIFGGVVFFLEKYRSRANCFLVALIIMVSLNNLQYYFRDIDYWSFRELMDIYYIPYASLNCTFLYLYVISLIYPERKLSIKSKMLFLPFIFFLLATTVYKALIFSNPNSENILVSYNNFANAHEFFAVVYSLVLVGFSFKAILKHEINSQTFNPIMTNQHLRWLKITLILLFIVIFVYAYLMVQVILYPTVYISFYALWIGNSFMVYWLGHIGIYKYGVQKERENIRKFVIDNPYDTPIPKKKNDTINKLQKLLVEGRRFLDSQISLERIADELNVSKGHLSRLVNSELDMGFTDYLNMLRVNEAKCHLTNPEFSNYTLTAIGLESGFNSKSTFFATFKKITSLTPAQYRTQMLTDKIPVH